MDKVMDSAIAIIDDAKAAISKCFDVFQGEFDHLLQDHLNKADSWLTTALSRCEELGGEKSVSKMSIDELFDEAERLQEQIAELAMENGHQSMPLLRARLSEIDGRLRKEGEV